MAKKTKEEDEYIGEFNTKIQYNKNLYTDNLHERNLVIADALQKIVDQLRDENGPFMIPDA